MKKRMKAMKMQQIRKPPKKRLSLLISLILISCFMLPACKGDDDGVRLSAVEENAEENAKESMDDGMEALPDMPKEDTLEEEAEDEPFTEDTRKEDEEISGSVSANSVSENGIRKKAAEKYELNDDGLRVTEDGKIVVDLVFFMGQSNMSGAGGNADYAPKVKMDHGYEFRAISDPTRLYPIEEPFGINESFIGGICDLPGAKKGSMVSSFANTYYKETGIPIVAVSISEGATTTEKWLTPMYQSDMKERVERALVWLNCSDYYINRKYAVWLQGESDAANGVTGSDYTVNMDDIIRPLFIKGIDKVFIVTPGRTLSRKDYFNDIIDAQIEMCRKSGYYALATTVLCGVSTEFMVDEWHYNQKVLNLVGEESAKSAATYTNETKEAYMYDYKHKEMYYPVYGYCEGDETVEELEFDDLYLD